MIRLILLTICIFALSNASRNVEKIKTKVIVLRDTESFLRENPNVELIPLEKKVLVNEENLATLQYTFGERKPGDKLYAEVSDGNKFPSPSDFELSIEYEDDYYVTYLTVDIEQSTSLGKAYVVKGGVGQKVLIVLVEAKNTTYFNYYLKLYVRD